jgi:hypothetical protein
MIDAEFRSNTDALTRRTNLRREKVLEESVGMNTGKAS